MKIRYLAPLFLVAGLVVSACASPAAPEEAPEAESTESSQPVGSGSEEELESDEQSTSVEDNEPASGGGTSFELVADESEARFIIGEILANAPNTVVGVTNQIEGGGVLNATNPHESRLSEFIVDSSSFVTDSSFRDRAIREFILQSSQYPAITFEPTEIRGIPDELIVGETVPFEVVGLLTVRDIAKEVTFSGEAMLTSVDRLEGLASATISRADFSLSIPRVQRVASVDEEFILEIEFVAIAS